MNSDSKKVLDTKNKEQNSKELNNSKSSIPNDTNSDELTIVEMEDLLDKYKKFVSHIDHRNMLYYGALFRELFKDFKTEEDDNGKIDKSIEDLSKLLERACDKLNFDIYNCNMKQLLKLYTVLIEKLGGSKNLRDPNYEILTVLLFRMYSDDEVIKILNELKENNINPNNIEGIDANDNIIFTNGKTYPLETSNKFNELLEIYKILKIN